MFAAGCVCAAVLLSGCVDVSMRAYERPATPEKNHWTPSDAISVSAADTISPDWWKAFGDPTLDALIQKAIAGNFDIQSLAARIRVASAEVTEAHAGALPTADLGAGVNYQKITNMGQGFTKQYNVAGQVNWDIDVWGAVEKSVEAQQAEFHATEADWRAGYLLLVSNVSTTYFQVLQLDDQIAQQQTTLDTNRQIAAILERMNETGLVPKTQVLQQRAEVNRLTTDLLEFKRSRDLANNALATLTGTPAGEFQLPAGHLQQRVQLPPVPAGLPAQMLARRPDIVAAEFRVLEAYKLTHSAKLAQLPTISLTGHGGSSSFALNTLLKSFTYGLMPSIDIPLLDPTVRAHVKTTEAQADVAEHDYQRTVMTAFQDVENALVNIDADRKQRAEIDQQVAQLKVVADQVEAQLKEGVVSQLEVFEAERSLLSAQQQRLANHAQSLSDTVLLYQALGGGWPSVDVQAHADSDFQPETSN
ncbi:efflux transporter outer membrane subunit [Pararobbsia silviterrae]|uniref:Efflux transporter outer membrane subunit n=1 Tax=Pararobbsia silviterrae TaxID=1792498 RepID=A0A494XS78_9BURK|nr:efflux transporter outer membrane subunit [Pararobbsia silviterrae]RKP53490.1 efflux transporter outer membrane subunit [Pararobbsia silviterrae]